MNPPHECAYFREAHSLVMTSSPISNVGAALRGRDALIARALPYLEAQLAAQGETPDRALLELQHELAAHLANPPGADAECNLPPATPLVRGRDNRAPVPGRMVG